MDGPLPPLPEGATLDQGLPPLPAGATLDSSTPKLPDTSGIQQIVQKNLTPQPDANGEAKEQTQTDAQRLDTSLGFSATGMLRSGNDGKNIKAPLPASIRGPLINSYKNGTSVDAGDYMQTALPAFARIGKAFQEGFSEATQGYKELGITPGSEMSEFLDKTNLDMFNPAIAAVDAAMRTGGGLISGGIAAVGQQYKEAGVASPKGGPDIAQGSKELADFFLNTPYLAELHNMNVGHEALKPIVGDAIGKEAKDVTPQDINQTIADGFQNAAPKASDFHDVATVMKMGDEGVDTLHQVYQETGVHPDQVFEDAKTHPEIAADLAAGKVPDAYAHLRETQPETTSLDLTTGETTQTGGEPPRKPPDVNSAYDPEHPFEEGAPVPTERSAEGASTSINPLAQILDPTNISKSSKDMATAIRQGRGPAAQSTAQIQDALQEFAKTFSGMGDKDRLAFINYMETRSAGTKLDPKLAGLQKAADTIKGIYAKMGDAMQKAFPDVGLRKDYFTHLYEDQKAAAKFFNDWVAKQGSERSLNARAFPTLAEAMEAGLKPKTTNPIETVMRYVTNMNNLIAADKTVKLAKDFGIADYFAKGEQPDGWVPLNGNLSEQGGKVLYAPEDAARVYNNDISEKASGPIGKIADVFQQTNNFASKLVLGLSGYHFTATTMASMASDVSRATLGDIGKALTPFSNTKEGSKYINAYLGREELPPELQKALDLAVKNNTINVKQQDYWKAGPAKDYIDVFKNGAFTKEAKEAFEKIITANPKESLSKAVTAVKEGKIIDAALHTMGAFKKNPVGESVATIANEVGRTMDTISKPLFDYYIPRIKISANIMELHKWLSDHPESTPEEQDRAAQDIGNSIDNRFGEMMRDNLFWHQITRQTLQTALLSYSWVAGGARMLEGVPDAVKTALGKIGLGKDKELTSNARYLLGMAATYAVVNGVRTYLGTGEAPSDWKDFVYPRTGGTTPEGKPERELLPSHIGQFTNYLHGGLGELGNELSPGLKLFYHITSNQDFRGLPITNENNSWFSTQHWGDYLKYTLGEKTPIGLKNFLQGEKKGSAISVLEQILGARPAPRFISDPEGYEAMMKHVNDTAYQRKLKSDRRLQEQYENTGETP